MNNHDAVFWVIQFVVFAIAGWSCSRIGYKRGLKVGKELAENDRRAADASLKVVPR